MPDARNHVTLRSLILYIMAALLIGLAYSGTIDRKPSRRGDSTASDTVAQTVPDPARVEGVSVVAESDTVTYMAPDSTRGLGLDTAGKTIFTRIDRSKVDIETTVTFSAKDSLVLQGLNNAHLYGEGTVEYQDFKLNSAEIRMELDSSTVYAAGMPDTAGVVQGQPIFKDKSGEYESETMKYNFKTERGYITGVITEQDEGFLQGGRAKRMEDGSFYVEDGKYTTCDDHEHPHFYFQLTRAKVRPDKDVVTGPAYMVLADVPLPIALPFGYFPFSKKYSSGVIFPSFGDDYNLGFYLRNGGYYFAINDNVDIALTGEIYTKGSWGLTAQSNYVKRYRYRGNFNISFLNTVYGDKGAPDYNRMRNFQVIWSHSQDAKANPNLNFSASVNFATSGYSRNDLNSYYNSSFTENTKSSTVNMTYRLPRLQMEPLGHSQHSAALAGLDSAGVIPQPERDHVADRTLQAQEICRRRALVREDQDVVLRPVPELADLRTGRVLQKEHHKGLEERHAALSAYLGHVLAVQVHQRIPLDLP